VTAEHGYGEKAIEDDLRARGVRHVVIPRKGRPGKTRQAAERRPAFRNLVNLRIDVVRAGNSEVIFYKGRVLMHI
jgi:IS5 family transposase